MSDQAVLRRLLQSLDGQSYKAYKQLKGSYAFKTFDLWIDYVQGDPFAAPSRLRVTVPRPAAGFPESLWENPVRAVALADFLTRQFYDQAWQLQSHRGSGKSGQIEIARPSQAILPRTAIQVKARAVEVRFRVGLPGFGRRIAGLQALALLCEDLPELVEETVLYQSLDPEALRRHCDTAEDAHCLRQQLPQQGLVAFIADEALLPRRSGVDDRPLESGILFDSPDAMRVSLTCPHQGQVTGLGIPEGVTLIVGGGYHGKSTLLRAIEAGIHNHIPGDGREYVVTQENAVKVRAEDGRSVISVDISPFINRLPQGQSTQAFSTSNASGSTSQAANIVEAIEAGATVLLVDEDTSATNFMIRDHRMQALIAKDKEPITPFIDKVRQLYRDKGISTVLVMGGSGDYFDVADRVIAMDNYCPQDVTEQAKALAIEYATQRSPEGGDAFGELTPRIVLPQSIDPRRGKREVSVKVRATEEIRIGTETVDLSAIEQLVESGQLKAISAAILYAQQYWMHPPQSLPDLLAGVMTDVAHHGLDCLEAQPTGDLVAFRALELAAVLNRLRTLEVANSR